VRGGTDGYSWVRLGTGTFLLNSHPSVAESLTWAWLWRGGGVGIGGYLWVPVLIHLMSKPSVAESLTWAWLWRYLRGRRCEDGRVLLGTGTYSLDVQTLCCRISDLGLAVEIPEGEAVRGWAGSGTSLLDVQTLCCRISDLGLAVEIPEGEAVRGRIGTVGYDWVQVHGYLIPIPLLQNL
jgi:hypothetical protein